MEEFRGIKLTNIASDVLETDEKIAQEMDYLAACNFNTVELHLNQ